MRSVPSRRNESSHACLTYAGAAPPLRSSSIGPPNFVATSTWSRRRAESAPEVLLAQGAAVDVGGVEHRDAGVERGVDDLLRRVGVDPQPKLLHPRPTTEASSDPIARVCMARQCAYRRRSAADAGARGRVVRLVGVRAGRVADEQLARHLVAGDHRAAMSWIASSVSSGPRRLAIRQAPRPSGRNDRRARRRRRRRTRRGGRESRPRPPPGTPSRRPC